MPDYVRVRDKATGTESSQIASSVEANKEAFDVFDADDKDHPIYDHKGDPAPPVFPKGSGGSNEDRTVQELKDEIARRNEGRAEPDLIPSTGLKADLIKAIEADDTKENL